MTRRLLFGWLLGCGLLGGCASPGTPPPSYSICSTQPGSYACQIDQYQNVDAP